MPHPTATELGRPQTLHAPSGDVHVAYQVGEGPWWLPLVGGVNKGHPDQADLDNSAAFARGRIEQASPKALAEIQPA